MSKCVAIHIKGCLGVIAVEEHTSGRDNLREERLRPEYSILASPYLSGMINGPLGIESMHENHTSRRGELLEIAQGLLDTEHHTLCSTRHADPAADRSGQDSIAF